MEKITYRKTLDVHKNGIQFTLQGFETADKLSRRIEINLTASGDTYELPLEDVVALMYITTPNSEEPSIEECTIKDNTVVYDVLPIVEEGITEMQLKLIGTNYDGARAVLVSPRFAVEVTKSNAEDESAEQTTTFTALENAMAKANAVYNSRLIKIELDELCIFRAHYADRATYETDSIQKYIMQITTDMDMTSLVRDGLTNFSASEVAEELDERYRDAFATAIYSDNLAKAYNVPTFVKWDVNTANTPYKANLSATSDGLAVCFGDVLTQHTAVIWTQSGEAFVRKTIGGVTEWTSCLTNKGGTINGDINLVSENQKPAITFEDKGGVLKGTVERDEQGGMHLDATDGQANITSGIKVSASESDEDALRFCRELNGEKKEYKLYGEHNLPHPAQIYYGTYVGTGEGADAYNKTIPAPFKPQIVYLSGHIAVRPNTSAYRSIPNITTKADVAWGENDNTITFSRVIGTSGSGVKFNTKGTVYTYIIIG